MKVLIADDDPVGRLILSRTLQSWGFEVEEAVDGDQAHARLIQEDAPTLAIIDWMMPGMDGPDVIAAVREQAPEPYRYMILLTARSETQDLVEGLTSGADDFLSKPLNQEALRARMRAGQRILDLQSQLIEAREALRYQATRDALTGVLNRATLMQRMSEELRRTERTGGAVGIAMIDLDHFKQVNDTYGHLAGDEVLRITTKRIERVLRSYDAIGRYGGEEFIAIFPDIDPAGLQAAAERLRQVIGDGAVQADCALIPVSASIGAAISYTNVDPNELIALADAALYRAKDRGRDRVELAYEMPIPMRKAS